MDRRWHGEGRDEPPGWRGAEGEAGDDALEGKGAAGRRWCRGVIVVDGAHVRGIEREIGGVAWEGYRISTARSKVKQRIQGRISALAGKITIPTMFFLYKKKKVKIKIKIKKN